MSWKRASVMLRIRSHNLTSNSHGYTSSTRYHYELLTNTQTKDHTRVEACRTQAPQTPSLTLMRVTAAFPNSP